VQSRFYKKIYAADIIRMACVFKPDDVHNKDIDIYGMKDCFILRYRAMDADNQSYCQLPKGHGLAFPSDYGGHRKNGHRRSPNPQCQVKTVL
jgi:hypothetical protein